MNGFIPNTLNQHNQAAAPVLAAVAPPAPLLPQPAILMNGAIPNNQPHPHVHPPSSHPQIVHYVQHPAQQQDPPQLMIPNGNVIQLAPSPPPSHQMIDDGPQAIYIQRQQQPVRMMMMNGAIPGVGGSHQSLQQLSMVPRVPHPHHQQQRMMHFTPNGTYATTVQTVGRHPCPGGQPMTTTLILTKPPPPKCLLCCLACCGLESLWFNPNFNFSRVIALICNILVDLLMILCLLSTNWLTTIKYRQGLWQYCIDVDSPRPLPFGLDDHDGCHWGRNAAYIKLSGFFAVACFSLAIIATILTSLGLSSRDPNKKYTFYRFALYINLGALLAIIVSLTLYPAFFYSELHHTNMVPANRPHWYFGWAYGVGWGAAIFLVGAILLLVCDKETEEIYYQERTIVHTAANNHLLQNHPLTNHNCHQSIKA